MGVISNGCADEVRGVNPPHDELIYPVGIAAVNGDRHLIVVNSNFDLLYNAGTVVAMDLARLDPLVEDTRGTYDDLSGVYTFESSTALRDFCRPGSDGVCRLDAASLIRKTDTIRLGAYASDLAITTSGDRAVIPVRGERSIVLIDIADDDDQVLDCGAGTHHTCDDAHRITGNRQVVFPIEPFQVATMDYTHQKDGSTIVETMGFATHRAGGEVSLFSIARRTGDGPAVYDNRLVDVIKGVVPGAAGLAVNHETGDIYVSGQQQTPDPRVAVLKVLTDEETQGNYLESPWFSQWTSISLADQLADGTDARHIAVSPDGRKGFVLVQNPPALLKLDLEKYVMEDMATVCREASRVDTLLFDNGTDDPADDKLFALVLCFQTSQMYVVDTEYMIPVVRTTGEGPQDLSIDRTRGLIYVANFSDSSISVFQSYPPFQQIGVRADGATNETQVLRIENPNQDKRN